MKKFLIIAWLVFLALLAFYGGSLGGGMIAVMIYLALAITLGIVIECRRRR